jgi:hypothetical protein
MAGHGSVTDERTDGRSLFLYKAGTTRKNILTSCFNFNDFNQLREMQKKKT